MVVQSESMASLALPFHKKTFDCFKMSNQLKLKFQLQTVFLLMIVVMNFSVMMDNVCCGSKCVALNMQPAMINLT